MQYLHPNVQKPPDVTATLNWTALFGRSYRSAYGHWRAGPHDLLRLAGLVQRKKVDGRPPSTKEKKFMEWEQIGAKWEEFAGSARAHWSKLNDDDWSALTGTKGHLIGRIQKRYGIAWKEAEKQVDEWSGGLTGAGTTAEAADAPAA